MSDDRIERHVELTVLVTVTVTGDVARNHVAEALIRELPGTTLVEPDRLHSAAAVIDDVEVLG